VAEANRILAAEREAFTARIMELLGQVMRLDTLLQSLSLSNCFDA
jgi:hypothetical protein